MTPAIRSTLILSIFAIATTALDARIPFQAPETERINIENKRTEALTKIGQALEDFSLLPLTKLDLMQVLENRIVVSEKAVFRYMGLNMETLNLSTTDIFSIFENTAVAALPISSKVCLPPIHLVLKLTIRIVDPKGKMLQTITEKQTTIMVSAYRLGSSLAK